MLELFFTGPGLASVADTTVPCQGGADWAEGKLRWPARSLTGGVPRCLFARKRKEQEKGARGVAGDDAARRTVTGGGRVRGGSGRKLRGRGAHHEQAHVVSAVRGGRNRRESTPGGGGRGRVADDGGVGTEPPRLDSAGEEGERGAAERLAASEGLGDVLSAANRR